VIMSRDRGRYVDHHHQLLIFAAEQMTCHVDISAP
jgi:hypothetical protein